MGVDYQLVLDARTDTEAVLDRVAATMGGTRRAGTRTIDVEGMGIYGDLSEEAGADEEFLEVPLAYSVRFRFTASGEIAQRNFIRMFAAAVAILREQPDLAGALLFNAEYILLRRLRGEPIRLGADWREYAEDETDPLLNDIERYAYVAPFPEPWV